MARVPVNIEFLGEVSTTMVTARERITALLASADASPGPQQPFGIVAESQSSGRGTGGRTWSSPPGNMYFTLCVPQGNPSVLSPKLVPVMPLICGLACRRAVLSLVKGLDPSHVAAKWPNDILYRGSKIGGTLVESEDGFFLIGMGVNVAVAPAVTDGGRSSTTVNRIAEDLGAPPTTPKSVAEAVWKHFFDITAADAGVSREQVVREFDAVMDRSLTMYKRVEGGGRDTEPLTAVGLNEWGHLRVRHADGAEETLCAEYLF